MRLQEMNTKQRQALQRRAERIHATPPKFNRKDIPCPVCGAMLRLTDSAFGRYYKCPKRGCKGHVGARPNGWPTKIPGPTAWDRLRLDLVDF